MRPLWLLGIFLYMFVHSPPNLPQFLSYLYFNSLSQLIGSTLALEYMRAGYFSSSIILSFLCKSFLMLS